MENGNELKLVVWENWKTFNVNNTKIPNSFFLLQNKEESIIVQTFKQNIVGAQIDSPRKTIWNKIDSTKKKEWKIDFRCVYKK